MNTVLTHKEDMDMTIVHILNFSIPIVMMLVIGFTVDKMCKPDAPKQEVE
jgi:hypothetical protein